MKRVHLLPIAIAMLVAACGAHTAGTQQGSRNVLSAEQMRETNAESVYQAVERLRPDWLTSRGPASITDASPTVPSVYIGGNRVGDIDYLRRLRIEDVAQIRYYEPGEAGVRFGMGNPRGVVDVVMRGTERRR